MNWTIKKILKKHNDTGQSLDFPFQTIADKFRIIESHMQPLIIPFDVDAENLISSLHHADQNFGKQFYTLIGLDLYDEVAGLSWEDTNFIKEESLIF